MSKLLKEYIALLLEQEPEAPEDAPFGQYLFADPNKKIRKDEAREKDTELEEEFLASLEDLYDHNEKKPIINLIKSVINDVKMKGFYEAYIKPPNQTVYRGMKVNWQTAANILNIPLKTIEKLQGGEIVNHNEPGTLAPNSPLNDVMSWTLDKDIAEHSAGIGRPTYEDKIGIILVADPSNSSNNFFLNPINILKKFDANKISPEGYLANEMETISLGSVQYKKAIYVKGTEALDAVLFECIQHLVKEALDEGKFEDAVKQYPRLSKQIEVAKKSAMKSKYIPWLVKHLKDSAVAKSDVYLTNLLQAIVDFDSLVAQNKIKGEKDINRYTFGLLQLAVEEAQLPSGLELRKLAKTFSKKLFEDETYSVIHPLSKEASMYYGKGTRWCISAKKNNAWGDYQDGRFLFLINKKTGDKDALYMDDVAVSVFNAKDEDISGLEIEKKYPSYILDVINNYSRIVFNREWFRVPKKKKSSLQEVLRKFDVSTFEKYGDLKGMLLYARYYLPSMGKGSSREAFAYGGNKVLKVALNEKGLSQNTTEASVFADKATSPSTAKVFKQRSVGGQVFWLISEIGRPLTSEKEFSSLMGFDWKTYENVIFYFGKGKAGNDLKGAVQFTRNIFEKNLKHFQQIGKQSNVVYYTKRLEDLQKVENSPFVAGIINAMKNHKLLYADLATVDHYGKNAAGKVILLDAGYTEDVWKQHYSTPSAQSADSEAGTKPAMPGGVVKPKQQQPQGSDAYLPSVDTSAPATAPARKR